MADVKWIKIVTNIFDDEKIRYIETLPNGDETIVIWFKILCLAGKSNNGGLLMMTDRLAYTEEMLSSIFQRDLKSVQLALTIFENLEMIERFDNKIYLTSWEKHQNVQGLDKIREETRRRVAKHREKQKQLKCNVTVTEDVTQCNATELERERDKEKNNTIVEIINYLNSVLGTNYKTTTKKTKDLIKARMNENFTIDDFKIVIDKKFAQWNNDEKMSAYLRPETLFSPKFEGYLNEKEVIKSKPIEIEVPDYMQEKKGSFGDYEEVD